MPPIIAAPTMEMLLLHARRSLQTLRSACPPMPVGVEGLDLRWGVFSTLRVEGRLRGCIGHIESTTPLWPTVWEVTMAAATNDPRFTPVQPDEVEGIRIDLSLLSPLAPVNDPGDIQVGHHGVVLRRAGRRSVFLPEVASQLGWDRQQLLQQLAKKAGLEVDAWDHPEARLFTFTTQKGQEAGRGGSP